jgi:hypothetical protein
MMPEKKGLRKGRLHFSLQNITKKYELTPKKVVCARLSSPKCPKTMSLVTASAIIVKYL